MDESSLVGAGEFDEVVVLYVAALGYIGLLSSG